MAKFNVGDKVRATADDWVSVGKLGEVIEYDGSDIMPYKVDFGSGGYWLNEDTFELITPVKPKKSERITALETQVAEQRDELVALQAKVEALEKAVKYPNTARFERESAEVDGILADIERKAKPTLGALLATYPPPVKSPNEQRADVIKRAKAFVTDALSRNYAEGDTPKMRHWKESVWFSRKGGSAVTDKAEFIVNTEKRTVVALIKTIEGNAVVHKGIAKCDPDDVFNADIGKAIALARALGVDVTESEQAVQPTEVVVGHIVKFFGYSGKEFAPARIEKVTNGNEIVAEGLGNSFFTPQKTGDVITDDTDAVYE